MKTKFVSFVMATCLLLAPISSSYALWGSGNSYSAQDTNIGGQDYKLNDFAKMQGYDLSKINTPAVKPSFWQNVGLWFSNAFSGIKDFAVKSFNFVKDISVKAFDSVKNIFVKSPDTNVDVATNNIDSNALAEQKTDIVDADSARLPEDKVEVAKPETKVDAEAAESDDVIKDVPIGTDKNVETDVVVEFVESQATVNKNDVPVVDTASSLVAPSKQNKEGFIPYKMALQDMSDTDLNKEVAVQEVFIKDYMGLYARDGGKVASVVTGFISQKQGEHSLASSELNTRQSVVGASVPDKQVEGSVFTQAGNERQVKADQNWQSQFHSSNLDQELYFPVFKPENVTIVSSGTINTKDVKLKLASDFANATNADNTMYRHFQGAADVAGRLKNVAIDTAVSKVSGLKISKETTKAITEVASSTASSSIRERFNSKKIYLLENDKQAFKEILDTVSVELGNNNVKSYNQNIITSVEATSRNIRASTVRYTKGIVAGVATAYTTANIATAISVGSNVDTVAGFGRKQEYAAGQVEHSLKLSYYDNTKINPYRTVTVKYRTGQYFDKTNNKLSAGVIVADMVVVGCDSMNSNCVNEERIYAPF